MNEEIIKKAFNEHELKFGAFSNWDGLCTRILTKPLIELIKDKIDFSTVKTVLDIGSRDGCQSLEFNRWFPDAKIYAFEPVKSSYDYIVNNVKNVKNISVLPYAISNEVGKIKFYEVYNGNIGASSILKTTNHPRSRQWQQKETIVDAIVIKDWLVENNVDEIDIAWIDVQGAEKIVLESFGSRLDSIKIIATEVGIAPLYQNAINKAELDALLSNFKCIAAESVGGDTEMDTIYINKKYL